ncbi:MAG TPA: PilZ domain-containing protein [Terriglobales bacterium]|nr:PilZ domain-containing protein [Terriglobales bacterium]
MTERGRVEQRRYPRKRVSWPVVLETDDQISFVETVDFSARGAKLWLRAAPPLGSVVNLHFHPEDGAEMHVQALTWRSDPDGVAFFFIGLASPLWIEAPWATSNSSELALAV